MQNTRTRFLFLSHLLLAGVLGLATTLAVAGNQASLSWKNICQTTVCRGTGHDGVTEARISPDGKWVAATVLTPRNQGIFLLAPGNGTSSLWVVGSDPDWFPDSAGIVYVHGGDLWAAKVGSTEPVRLTDDEQDVRAPRVSPDGERVAFYSTRSGHQDLWVVNADGLSEPDQLTRAAMNVDESRFVHAWSPDGKAIAYFSNRTDYWQDDLWLVDVESREERPLSSSFMGRSEPSWSPDGTHIAVHGTAKSEFWYGDLSDIYIVHPESGREWPLDMQVNTMEINRVVWSGDGQSLFFPSHKRGEIELWRAPLSGGIATRMTNSGGVIHGFDATASGDSFVMVRSTATRGREVDYLADTGGDIRQLTNISTDWEGLVEPEEISFRSTDGHYIQAFRFTPPGFDPDGNYPALVQVHGGGTNSYYNGLNLVEQRLAQQGYVVLAVNYRGGSGFGRRFQDIAVNDWANGQALDAAAAAGFLRAQPWSSGKVGIYGYSYGGIISLAAVTRAPAAFDAAVPMGGIYDFADAYETADRLGKLFTREGHDGSPEERADIYATSNSVTRIEALETPVLIMHGEADTRAPFRQYQLVVDALERHEKVFEAHSYPGEPHGFRDPENRVDMYQRLEAWMDRWLR